MSRPKRKFGNVPASADELAKANDWLRKHADDLKGLEDAKHLRPAPAATPPSTGDTPATDPTCDFCNSPIFDEYRDAKNLEYCTRPKCRTNRRKFELQQERIASGELDLIACVDDEEDDSEDRDREGDAIDDAEELPRKVLAMEEGSTETDLRTSSVAEDDVEDEDKNEEEFEDDDEQLEDDEMVEDGDETEEGREDEDEDSEEEFPEGTTTDKIKDYGVVPTAFDLSDDTPKILTIRRQLGLPEAKTDHTINNDLLDKTYLKENRLCKIHKVYLCAECGSRPEPANPFIADSRSSSRRSGTELHLRVQKIEDKIYGRVRPPEPEPETTDELVLLEREAKRIEKERLEKEDMERRKIVRKPRVRPPKPKEIPNLRRQYKFSTRQVADVMDIRLFNKPFRVLDRSLLYDSNPNPKMRNIYHKWYTQIAKDAKDRCVPIWEGKRRGDDRYENPLDKQEKTEFEIVDGKPTVVSAGYVPPEIVMIDGVAVSVDPVDVEALAPPPPKPPKLVSEPLPNGSVKIHVVKILEAPAKIKRASDPKFPVQKSPSTYGELLNALPYRWETILTKEERDFYRDYAARNLNAAQLKEKHGEKTKEDILLLENRAIRHAFKLRLLDPPLAEMYEDWDCLLDEDIKLDIRMISKSGGAYIAGGVTGGKLNRYGKTMGLNSFRTRPIRESGSGSAEYDNGAPDHDDFGDESAA